jgi:hypothetical protein
MAGAAAGPPPEDPPPDDPLPLEDPLAPDDEPASDTVPGLHVTMIVSVSRFGLQVEPAGTGPSPTASVTIAGPTWVHVKFDVAALGELKDPVDEDHA